MTNLHPVVFSSFYNRGMFDALDGQPPREPSGSDAADAYRQGLVEGVKLRMLRTADVHPDPAPVRTHPDDVAGGLALLNFVQRV
jgi:hypothetical protein